MSDLPSVTAILADVGLSADYNVVPSATLKRARLRGQGLHRAIHYDLLGMLDEASVHPEVLPGLQACREWRQAEGFELVATEIELVHPTWKFIGHPDAVGRIDGHIVIVDWKGVDTLALAPVAYQLAAYGQLWTVNHPTEPVTRLIAVQLGKDGVPKPHDLTDYPRAWQRFQAALVVYRAKREG